MEELAYLSVPGVRLGAVAAGIRYKGRNDLVLMALPEGADVAAVFTRNAFCAAPVSLARENLAAAPTRYLLINSGNANAGTGARGMTDAKACCAALAAQGGCDERQVLPFSTGVIGENLPVARIEQALPALLEGLSEDGWPTAARAIMTTDTVPKLVSRRFSVDGREAVVTGMAKGAGMIHPDMATMLAYLATDLSVDRAVLQRILEQAVDPSFNSITVDGDTSTNDACVLVAGGSNDCPRIDDLESPAGQALAAAVDAVCLELATALVRDAEGATKLVSIEVDEAADRAEARDVAFTIAHSPLVKTALFASDPNWGRILAAVGRAGLEDLDIDKVRIWLDNVCIVRDGGRAADYTEQAGRSVVGLAEFSVRVRLGRGDAAARVLTCDLSYDYVKINAEYRT